MKKLFIMGCLLLGSVASFAQRDLGYRGFFDIGGGIGVGSGARFMLGASTAHGYQAAPFLFFGVGIAANDIAYKSNSDTNDGLVVPVFGDVRVDLGSGRLSPFVDVRGGYDFICGNGLYINPSIGGHYAFSDNFGMNVSLGYDLQGTKGAFYIDGKKKKTLSYISLKVGIDF